MTATRPNNKVRRRWLAPFDTRTTVIEQIFNQLQNLSRNIPVSVGTNSKQSYLGRIVR